MRDADPADVPNELGRAAACRVNDRESARHCLDDERRAGVLDLRVEEDVRSPEDRRRVPLRVLPDEVDVPVQAELIDERPNRADEAARHEESRVGSRLPQRPERPKRELEPVLLCLVAAEE